MINVLNRTIRAIALVLFTLGTRSAMADAVPPANPMMMPCAKYLESLNDPQAAAFTKMMLELGQKYKWYGDTGAMSMEARLKYTKDYCEAHPSGDLAAASDDLALHTAQGSPRISDNRDFEADPDVRAYVLAEALPSAGAGGEGEFDDGPDVFLSWRLARETTGKIGHVPDLISVLFNDTGEKLPEFGPDLKVLATVFSRRHLHDKPPSGNEDEIAKAGVPVFYIGSHGRDIWEIGRHAGVISIRLDNDSSPGPWEPFQSDVSKYQYYGAHILDGRTADQNFADKRVAALAQAACTGDGAAIAKALASGADPNTRGLEGDTPLFWALDCGNLIGLEALLKAGADPNYKLPGKSYFAMTAWGEERKPIWIGQYSPLYASVRDRNIAALKLLLKYGADPNTFKNDRDNDNAFKLALAHDDDSFELMLDADKNLNTADSVGNTLADQLATAGRPEKVEMLLRRGYDHELVDLGAGVQNSEPWTNDKAARLRVIDLLKTKGVYFPVASRPQRWAQVKMDDDGTLYVHWGDLHSRHGVVDVSPDQMVKKGMPLYDQLVNRVGGLMPGETKHIERRLDDATD